MFYVLKQNATREGKYQETIAKLADRLAVVDDIKQDLGEIKGRLEPDGKT